MNKITASIVSVTLAVASVGAFAQTASTPTTPRIDQREANQQARIAQGAASGQLTPKETDRLEKGQARIDRTEARAKSDGVVTGAERKHLRHEETVASKKIYKQKHDAQTAK